MSSNIQWKKIQFIKQDESRTLMDVAPPPVSRGKAYVYHLLNNVDQIITKILRFENKNLLILIFDENLIPDTAGEMA